MNYFVYLAGSIAKSKEEKQSFVDWRDEVQHILEGLLPQYPSIHRVTCLNPNTADLDMMPIEYFFGRDTYMISIADALIVNVQNEIGLGTAQEFLIAKYYNKPVIAVAPPDSPLNKIIETDRNKHFRYIHPFLLNTADIIAKDFYDSLVTLLGHFSKKNVIEPKSINIIEHCRSMYDKKFKEFDSYVIEVLSKR